MASKLSKGRWNRKRRLLDRAAYARSRRHCYSVEVVQLTEPEEVGPDREVGEAPDHSSQTEEVSQGPSTKDQVSEETGNAADNEQQEEIIIEPPPVFQGTNNEKASDQNDEDEETTRGELDQVGHSDACDESLLLPGVHDSADEDENQSDEEGEEFNQDKASDALTEWMLTQPRENKQSFSVMLMDHFIVKWKFVKTRAAQEAAEIVKVNEKTVRRWHKEFYDNKGCFSEDARGQYERLCVLNDEDCRKKALAWVRGHVYNKGGPIMTAADFLHFVNSSLLPGAHLPEGYPQQISLRTARSWLHQLGFKPTPHRKGLYFDGHERKDVVEYRGIFLRKLEILESTHKPPPLCEDGLASTNSGLATAVRELVLIYHDESCFHSNEDQGWQWAEEGRLTIKPKGKGRGLMVSDFIDEHDGFLAITPAEATHLSRCKAREILKYGSDQEGYWNNEKFMEQVKIAADIAELKYPHDRFSVVWLFDQSSGHCAYEEDALNVLRMNVKPGGKQPVMRTTVNPKTGKPQSLVDHAGIPKGMKQVLKERGVNTDGMKAEDMRKVLGSHHDFKYEKTRVEHYLHQRGHRVLFIPKYHCKLNPIERVWAEAKRFTRKHCNYTFPQLERTVEPALDSVDVQLIRKYFRKAREYMNAYVTVSEKT